MDNYDDPTTATLGDDLPADAGLPPEPDTLPPEPAYDELPPDLPPEPGSSCTCRKP